MPRVLIVLLGVVVAGLLGASPASADSVVRIADPTLATNASAVTQYNNVYMLPAGSSNMQRWRIVPEQGATRFVNVGTGGCLTEFNRFGDIEGNLVTQEYCLAGWMLQQWRITENGNGTARVTNVLSGKCLTIWSHGGQDSLLLFTCGTQPRQDFRVVNA